MKRMASWICALLLMFCLCCGCAGQDSGDGSPKQISVTVTAGEQTQDFHYTTSAETLRAALEENGLIKGEESQYGLFVTEVNGIRADESKEEWWCFTQGGEQLLTGVDSTAIHDGDHFEITLKTGYED